MHGCSFNNEAMAFVAFEYLYKKVDFFLLTESEMSQRGRRRTLPTLQTKELLTPFADKIAAIQLNFSVFDREGVSEQEKAWDREVFQRDSIATAALERFGNKKFILVIADADEVPDLASYDALAGMYDQLTNNQVHFTMRMFYYSFTWVKLDGHAPSVWKHTYAVNDQYLRRIEHSRSFTSDMRYMRLAHANNIIWLPGGWHCSACMAPERISEKSKSFVHVDYPIVSVEWAQYCIDNGVDMFNRSDALYERNTGADFPYCGGCKTLQQWIDLVPKTDSEEGAPI